eukprot:gnl/TRDRNA2_/TRDRNA2_87928_c0_seq1.p1 gnl/TRDRNA2_/TRDRNA2_87928_c0~~gnl/TRDRNA2_/TRDRNA2_87928_c0_seq1.p1  ORF type:complete len:390 (+),score=60.09 gnl/TRDRNA2_/TRDRNA2_87928_c0_seq1:131-1171(+)
MRAAAGKHAAGAASVVRSRRSKEKMAAAVDVYRRAADISPHASHILGKFMSDGSEEQGPLVPMKQLIWHNVGDSQRPGTLEDGRLRGVCSVNAFSDLDESIFPAASMANHSCMPNAVVVKLGDAFLLRARREIGEGEEITINYFDVLTPLDQRIQRCKAWGFICDCPRCKTEREVPANILTLPLFMNTQLQKTTCIHHSAGAVATGPVLSELRENLQKHFGRNTERALWVSASFVSLFETLVLNDMKNAQAWRHLLQLFEAVNPGSFVHCKLVLKYWLSCSGQTIGAEKDAAASLCAKVPAQRAWYLCASAHRLRYGQLEGEAFLRLVEETRHALDGNRQEFCDML